MMKIQFLNGGLANQTFQYIFARYYELSHPGEIMYLDDSYFAYNTVHNGYELDKVFGLHPHMLSECFSKEDWKFLIEERKKGKSVATILMEHDVKIAMIAECDPSNANPFGGVIGRIPCNQYFPNILNLEGNVYYHGYWINKNWFNTYRDDFLKELQFPEITDSYNLEILNRIEQEKSVALHIRRGDFVTLGRSPDNEVYMKLCTRFVKEVGGKWTVFVFSDDIEWAKVNADSVGISLFEKAVYVEGNLHGKNYIDMQLMSKCKAMIVSNSSFCYLAALLNQNLQYVMNTTRREI